MSGRQVIVAQGGRELEALVAPHGRAKLCLCLVHDTLSERAALWRPYGVLLAAMGNISAVNFPMTHRWIGNLIIIIEFRL